MSARYIYKIRVDSVVGTDASGSSNVWAVDVCAVDQMVVTLVTEYTACGIYSLVPKLICSYEKDTLMRKIQGHLLGSHIICWH